MLEFFIGFAVGGFVAGIATTAIFYGLVRIGQALHELQVVFDTPEGQTLITEFKASFEKIREYSRKNAQKTDQIVVDGAVKPPTENAKPADVPPTEDQQADASWSELFKNVVGIIPSDDPVEMSPPCEIDAHGVDDQSN